MNILRMTKGKMHTSLDDHYLETYYVSSKKDGTKKSTMMIQTKEVKCSLD